MKNSKAPALSDKLKSSEKICLVESERVVIYDKVNADISNKSFSSAIKNLRILDFIDTEPLADIISRLTLKDMRYRNHPSISAIKSKISGKTFKGN